MTPDNHSVEMERSDPSTSLMALQSVYSEQLESFLLSEISKFSSQILQI